MGAPVDQYTLAVAQGSIDPSDNAKPTPVKDMAYNVTLPQVKNQLYRVERGQPFVRAGQYVFATPQFKALSITSPVQQTVQVASAGQFTNAVVAVQAAATVASNSQVTSVKNTPISVKYPAKTV